MADGKSQEIANELDLSDKTIKNHIHHIFQKLNATDLTKAEISAMRLGLIVLK